MKRRQFINTSAMTVAGLMLDAYPAFTASRRKPNFIIILCDDLGFGDVGFMGGKTVHTPNIDRMAHEGTVLTDYYAPANICTPSRAGLLTGRYPIRTGLGWQVIMPNDKRGLALSEVTIAQALRPAGYVSALIGKWHLGHIAPYWPPTQHGFDLFFGLPYSHDMQPLSLYTDNGPGVELTKEDVIFTELQQRFWRRAQKFIEDHADKPFFLELALSAPHLPNDPNPAFRDRSSGGAYGDVVEEIDAIVGQLSARLKALGIERDTLVVFTSDNGPWYEGSAGGLRERKGGAGYDGGYRVPFFARMPGTVPAAQRVNSIAMGIDFLPTLCAMAGVPLPAGVELDGKDISAVLMKGAPSPHDELILFDNEDVVAIRTQRWKYVAATYYRGYLTAISGRKNGLTDSPQLYDMAKDISESYSAASHHPDVVLDMQSRLSRAKEKFAPFKITGDSSGPKTGPAPQTPAPHDHPQD
jgi:arylsulfatase A